MYIKSTTTYAPAPEFLASDHYTSQTCTVTTAMGTTVDGRKIVKAGTVFPANNATAKGLIIADVDVTDGPAPAAYIDHGLVYSNRLPVAIDALALPVLKGIILREYK